MRFLFLVVFILACSSPPSDIPDVVPGGNFLEKGRYLTTSLGHCGVCHGPNLSGGLALEDSFGVAYGPNLTTLHGRSVKEIVSALRESKNPEAHRGYEWISDADAISIATYLRSLYPIQNDVPKRDIDFFTRNTKGFFTSTKNVRGAVPEFPEEERGKYLVNHVARCAECHSSPPSLLGSVQYFGGGKEIKKGDVVAVAPALGDYSKLEIVAFLRSGLTPDGRESKLCPTEYFRKATKSDLELMAGYIEGLRN
jgi:mono/diheme cytochrome c family protein